MILTAWSRSAPAAGSDRGEIVEHLAGLGGHTVGLVGTVAAPWDLTGDEQEVTGPDRLRIVARGAAAHRARGSLRSRHGHPFGDPRRARRNVGEMAAGSMLFRLQR